MVVKLIINIINSSNNNNNNNNDRNNNNNNNNLNDNSMIMVNAPAPMNVNVAIGRSIQEVSTIIFLKAGSIQCFFLHFHNSLWKLESRTG